MFRFLSSSPFLRKHSTDRHSEQPDDELEKPFLAGFEWDKDESWTRLIVHLQKDAGPMTHINKKKKKGGDE